MVVHIKDVENNKDMILDSVEQVLSIHENYTQSKELKNSVLIIHKTNHIEKFRLYKNVRIVKVEDKN